MIQDINKILWMGAIVVFITVAILNYIDKKNEDK